MDMQASIRIIVVFLCLAIGGEAIACNSAPTAEICPPDPKYAGAGLIMIDGSCSSDPEGNIQKYEWDFDYDGSTFDCDYYETSSYAPDGAFDGKHYNNYSPGTYTTRLRVTDRGSLTSEDQCTVYAVKLEVDVGATFPQWVHVDDSLALGCTVAPSGLGGTYSWSKEIGPGTITFSPSASVEDPTFSADKRGVYRAMVEYTVGDLTLWDNTANIYVVEVELFRDSACTKRLDDWPVDGSNPRSPKYLFGKDDPIYVRVAYYAPLTDTWEYYDDAVKVTCDSHSNVVYLDVNELFDGGTSDCYNKYADNELLLLDESTSDNPTDNDKIEVKDEDVLTFWLEVPPESGTYIESNSVMVDRGEYAMATQKPDSWGWFYDIAEDFSAPLASHFKWWANGDEKGPTEDFIRAGGTNSQSDIMSIAGHGLPEEEPDGYYQIKLNGSDYVNTDDEYAISAHEEPPGTAIPYRYWNGVWELFTFLGAGGGIEDNWGSDMEWVIITACKFLRNDMPSSPSQGDLLWNKDVIDDVLFGDRPAHGVFGYSDSPYLKDCDEVMASFFNRLTGSSFTLVAAWKQAVIAETGYDYGIVMHKDNELDKLTQITRDTSSSQMKYWYSVGTVDQTISYTNIASEGPAKLDACGVNLELEFAPSAAREPARYLIAEMETVSINGLEGSRTASGIQVFGENDIKFAGLDKVSDARAIAQKLDERFSKEVGTTTCFEGEYNAYTNQVTSNEKVGMVHLFAWSDGRFPIAMNQDGNFAKIMFERGVPVLVGVRLMKPVRYIEAHRSLISQQRAVETVKQALAYKREGRRVYRITNAVLEYEDSGRRRPDGTIELVPVWRVDIESEEGKSRSFVRALEDKR